MPVTQTLKQFNFTDHEISVYLSILKSSEPLSPKQISSITSISEGSVYRILERFSKKNIVQSYKIENVMSYSIDLNNELSLSTLILNEKINHEVNLDSKFYLDQTMKKIAAEMAIYLDAVAGAVFVLDKENRSVKGYELTPTKIGKFISNVIPVDFRTMTTSYKNPVNNIGKCVAEKKIFIGNNLSDFVYPDLAENIANIIQFAGGIKTFITSPIMLNNEVISAVILAFDKKYDEKSEKILEMVRLFTEKVAISINIALKYEEIKKCYMDILDMQQYQDKLSDSIQSLYLKEAE